VRYNKKMINLLFSDPLAFIVIFGGLLLSIAVHEFAHAWAADRLGDPTPRIQGRLTLDPRAHLDPIGTLALLFTRFGWGKPVQFDPYNLKEPLRDAALISLAGPVTNIVIALALALLINLNLIPFVWLYTGLVQVLVINVVLAIFNLVPVYPLDGSKILVALLPAGAADEYNQFMRRYGMMVLLFLLFPWNGISPVSQLIGPVIDAIVTILL
jgi:Zn-dependent protease